jgi:predicted RNA-binding Zn-ribbon protein involved in translation (DUF1610 family)
MSISLNCLKCGFKIALPDAYENYRGEVRCWVCHGMLEVTLEEGQLKTMRLCPECGPLPTETNDGDRKADSPAPARVEGGG